jgi:PAS domain S-box-containing protein
VLEFIRSSYFQGLLNSLSISIVIFNSDGTVYAVNNSASSLFGFPPDQYVGIAWTRLIHGFDDQESLLTMVQAIIERGQAPSDSISRRYVKPTGQVLHVTVSASPLMYYGKLFGIVLEINDVTALYIAHELERKMLEERSQIQQERYESLRKLSMSVAHQIRNPAMVVGGMAKILAKECSSSSTQMELLTDIIASMRRLEAIVTAVHEYESLVVKDRRLTSVESLVRDAKKMAVERIPDMKTNAVWFEDLVPGELVVDPLLMSKALCEIIVNSLEAIPQSGGTITIRGETYGETYRIAISDNGCGIQESDMHFIFDTFFTRKAVGVGMGLCMAQRIVQEHGGRMGIESLPGRGTTVSIFINLSKTVP